MAYNGAGVFERLYSWVTDKAGGIKVRADRMDAEMDGIATGLSNAICRDGQSTVSANLPMNSKKLTGLAAGSAAGDSVRFEQVFSGAAKDAEVTVAAVAGTTDVLGAVSDRVLISGAEVITSLGTGTNKVKIIRFGGASTLTHNGTSLILPGGANLVVAAGDMLGIVSDGSSNVRATWFRRGAVASTPGMVLLASGTVTDAATLDVSLVAHTGYRGFKFILANFIPATDGTFLVMRFSTDGGANYITTGYSYTNQGILDSTDVLVVDQSAAGNSVTLCGLSGAEDNKVGNATSEGCSSEVALFDPTSAATFTRVIHAGYFMTDTATSEGAYISGGGVLRTAQNTDAVRFLFIASGNIASGTYSVYGLT